MPSNVHFPNQPFSGLPTTGVCWRGLLVQLRRIARCGATHTEHSLCACACNLPLLNRKDIIFYNKDTEVLESCEAGLTVERNFPLEGGHFRGCQAARIFDSYPFKITPWFRKVLVLISTLTWANQRIVINRIAHFRWYSQVSNPIRVLRLTWSALNKATRRIDHLSDQFPNCNLL